MPTLLNSYVKSNLYERDTSDYIKMCLGSAVQYCRSSLLVNLLTEMFVLNMNMHCLFSSKKQGVFCLKNCTIHGSLVLSIYQFPLDKMIWWSGNKHVFTMLLKKDEVETVLFSNYLSFLLAEVKSYYCFVLLMKRMNANFPHGGNMDNNFANMRSLIQVKHKWFYLCKCGYFH